MALTWLEIRGFRSYAEPQRFDFDGVLTVVDGANSQGKTSTAHIDANAPVWVRAGIVGSDEVEHTVERLLEADYTVEDECRVAVDYRRRRLQREYSTPTTRSTSGWCWSESAVVAIPANGSATTPDRPAPNRASTASGSRGEYASL